MKQTYLIQRLEPPLPGQADNPFSFGGGLRNGGLTPEAMGLLRPIFSFEYMGAAEFEWGAVPNALDRMTKSPLAATPITFDEVDVARRHWRKDGPLRITTVYLLAPAHIAGEAEERIRTLAKEDPTFSLKEESAFTAALRRPEGSDYPRTVGWLELDNGFMWFIDRDMWAKTCALFGVEVDAEVR